MSYRAIITPITHLREHPNADRLQLATAAGHQVVTSLDTVEGTLGIFFPEGGCLSHEHCVYNNLYRNSSRVREMYPDLFKSETEKGGLFEHNRRVKAQVLRKERSEGYWEPLSALAWTGADLSKLEAGQELTASDSDEDSVNTLNGVEVCRKYFTPATLKQRGMGGAKAGVKKKHLAVELAEHFDTKKVRNNLHIFQPGDRITLTEKVHGTSGRTGHMPYSRKPNKWQWFWRKLFRRPLRETGYMYASGTRRVILDPERGKVDSYYEGTSFRQQIHEEIKAGGLRQGETLYYEIVGYTDGGGAIMKRYDLKEKVLRKRYGKEMTFSYGCEPPMGEDTDFDSVAGNVPHWKVLVYRITMTSPDGHVTELSWEQIKQRCVELGLETVPEFGTPFYFTTTDDLLEKLSELADGHSTLDERHMREGVAVRIDHANGATTVLKYKGFWFCEIEGIRKNDDNYVDPEETA